MRELLFTQLYPYIKPYRWKIFLAILLSFAMAGIGALQVSLVKPIFDQGLNPDASTEEVYLLAAQLMALGLLNFPCRFYHFYTLRYVVDRAAMSVRQNLFEKLQRLPTSSYSKSRQGTMVSYVINDSHVFSQGLRAMVDLIREPLKGIAYLSMAFWADWQLALGVLLVAPMLAAIFSISGKKVMRNQGNVQESNADVTHTAIEGISAHKLTKAFNLQKFVQGRFKDSQERFFTAQMKTTFVQELAHPFVEVVGALAFSGVIVFAHYRIQSGAMTIGAFISFVAALALFMDPMRKFSQANIQLNQSGAAAKRIFELFASPEEKDDGKQEITSFEKIIEAKNLSFSYGEGPILKNFSMHISKGEKIALVGLSGSGKSTMINLLLGLYPVEQGELKIDGVDINEVKLKSLRSLYGLVSQDIFLFNDTIRGNLCLGQSFSDEEIYEALNVAYATEFVDKLPEGIETKVGDRGTRLSGGQQQRLTIARAFLHRPQILLFDEATSALDNESEKVVQQALEKIGRDKTVIAVAHRLSTIQDYDRIYVLSEGVLVESGTHEQLMQRGGEYAKLYELSQKK